MSSATQPVQDYCLIVRVLLSSTAPAYPVINIIHYYDFAKKKLTGVPLQITIQ